MRAFDLAIEQSPANSQFTTHDSRLTPHTSLLTPHSSPVENSWHLYVVRSGSRDALRAALAERGIETLIHYPIPPHLSGAYEAKPFRAGSLPVTERMANEVLSLPIGPHLGDREVTAVIEAVRSSIAEL
ncbi:MAG: DegT/DnrJ/EryC1/StrS family aminotransferase [Thermoanaerobaculia bacterium]